MKKILIGLFVVGLIFSICEKILSGAKWVVDRASMSVSDAMTKSEISTKDILNENGWTHLAEKIPDDCYLIMDEMAEELSKKIARDKNRGKVSKSEVDRISAMIVASWIVDDISEFRSYPHGQDSCFYILGREINALSNQGLGITNDVDLKSWRNFASNENNMKKANVVSEMFVKAALGEFLEIQAHAKTLDNGVLCTKIIGYFHNQGTEIDSSAVGKTFSDYDELLNLVYEEIEIGKINLKYYKVIGPEHKVVMPCKIAIER